MWMVCPPWWQFIHHIIRLVSLLRVIVDSEERSRFYLVIFIATLDFDGRHADRAVIECFVTIHANSCVLLVKLVKSSYI